MTEVSKLIGQLWREASAETKAYFAELAAASKVGSYEFLSFVCALIDLFRKKKLIRLSSLPPPKSHQAAADAFAAENPEAVAAAKLAASQKRANKKSGGASSVSAHASRPRTALELFSADVAATVSAAAGGARGAELKKLVLEAWEGASASARAPYISRAAAEGAAFAAAVAAAGGGGGGGARGGGNGGGASVSGGASKTRGRRGGKKKSDDDELEETEAFLADAAQLKSKLCKNSTPDTDDEDEEEREMETDWAAAPPSAILGLSPKRKHLLVARAGAPLFAYGLVSASLAARSRAGDPEALATCPLPPALLDEFEESTAAFDRDLAARSDGTGGYDLAGIADALCVGGEGGGGAGASCSSFSVVGPPNAATAAPPLDSFALRSARCARRAPACWGRGPRPSRARGRTRSSSRTSWCRSRRWPSRALCAGSRSRRLSRPRWTRRRWPRPGRPPPRRTRPRPPRRRKTRLLLRQRRRKMPLLLLPRLRRPPSRRSEREGLQE